MNHDQAIQAIDAFIGLGEKPSKAALKKVALKGLYADCHGIVRACGHDVDELAAAEKKKHKATKQRIPRPQN